MDNLKERTLKKSYIKEKSILIAENNIQREIDYCDNK